ncbi:MAG: C69 family dipeptidase, partial [Promethearchaeota archaeon]
ANEHGVVIGNEALLTKVKPAKSGLTGMDLLRLGLERGNSAKEALDTIIKLLQEYGQGGRCGYRYNMDYMNSFIIADKTEAYVLETIKKDYAWKKIEGVWAISNKISLHHDYDYCTPGLIEYAIKKRWAKSETDFDFCKAYSDKLITWGGHGKWREETNKKHLEIKAGNLETRDFMETLRFHSDSEDWTPDQGLRMTICDHGGNSLIKNGETAGSLVANLGRIDETPRFYVIGTPNPCMSPYFPIFAPDTELPEKYTPADYNLMIAPNGEEDNPVLVPTYQAGLGKFDPESFWWNAAKYHWDAIDCFSEAQVLIRPQVVAFEKSMLDKIENSEGEKELLNQDNIDKWFNEVQNLHTKFAQEVHSLPHKSKWWKLIFKHYWARLRRINEIPKRN